MNSKRILCIVLVLTILVGFAGCKKEEPYPYGKYTRQEVLDLFNQNRDLFDELVDAILADTYFLENGDVHPERETFVMPGDERYMELFNERSQEAIRRVLEYKPYRVAYDFCVYGTLYGTINGSIRVAFIGDFKDDQDFSFHYLVEPSDQKVIKDYMKYLEQDYYVEDLGGGGIFTADVLE